MEELEYFLKEWFDSYVVLKKLTCETVCRIDYNTSHSIHFDKNCICFFRIKNCVNIEIFTNKKDLNALRELDKIITGFAFHIDNKETKLGYIYRFKLDFFDEKLAKSFLERLIE